MEKDGQRLEVREHIMTQNMWEFYVLEEPDQDGVSFAFVSGDCNELGYVSLDEIKPFIISRTKQMDEIFPAPGFSWVDN
jgi:hypothetical protein